MAARSKEREEYLAAIISTAIEGSIGYWSQCSQYQWVNDEGDVNVVVGEQDGEEARATIHQLNDDESDYSKDALVITTEVIAAGISKILKGETNVADRIVNYIKAGEVENDAGEIDGEAADVIVQAGLFKEVVYG